MDVLHDPMYRATGDPFWDRRIEAELPSRQRLIAARSELAALRRASAASRGPWPRRAMLRLGDGLVRVGEQLRAGHGPPVASAPSRPLSQ